MIHILSVSTSMAVILSIALQGGSFAAQTEGKPGVQAPIEFNRDVRPILSDNCFYCHGNDPSHRKGELRLDIREEALAKEAFLPGNPEKSELVKRLFTTDADDLMPPPDSHKKLTTEQREILKRWIAEGAKYQKHWSFESPNRTALPQVKDPNWVRNPIDRFVLATLEKKGIKPAPEADRATLARRLSLDIIGLPPTPDEVQRFVQDKAADADDRFITELMKRPQWGEHRARYWLDAARYADTHGMHVDAYREIWPYRDWVVSAFNRNQPFDQFTIEQIAGDLLKNPTREQLIATGFHRCNVTTAEGGTIPEENFANYAADRVTTTSWVWLGLTANCAQCHDHKFDPISQKDFYSMSAYFRNTTQAALDGNVKDTKPVVYIPEPSDESRHSELPGLIAQSKDALAKRRNAAVPEMNSWVKTAKASDVEVAADVMVTQAALKDGIFDGDARSTGEMEWQDGGPLGKAPPVSYTHLTLPTT
jgi:hypothetical protein